AAHLLANPDNLDGVALRQAYQDQVVAPMRAHEAPVGLLASAAAHCAKVTASYWPGLFCCYDVPDLPRTVPRSGAVVRRGTASGAARDGTQGRFACSGGARSRAGGGAYGDTTPPAERRRVATAQPGRLEDAAPAHRCSPSDAAGSGPLPPRSRHLPRHLRTT